MAEWLLYEHDDGRHAVAPSAEAATFAHGDPAWHRVGPVEVPACRKCGGAMKAGKAMAQTVDCSDEGTCSPAGPGKLIDCMKCERCGWSVTAGVDSVDGSRSS
jgi:hypothetical protein